MPVERRGSFLGTTSAFEACVVRRKVGPLERAAARVDSVIARYVATSSPYGFCPSVE